MCHKIAPECVFCVPEMNRIYVPKKVVEQTGVDVMQLPEIQGIKYIMMIVNFFS